MASAVKTDTTFQAKVSTAAGNSPITTVASVRPPVPKPVVTYTLTFTRSTRLSVAEISVFIARFRNTFPTCGGNVFVASQAVVATKLVVVLGYAPPSSATASTISTIQTGVTTAGGAFQTGIASDAGGSLVGTPTVASAPTPTVTSSASPAFVSVVLSRPTILSAAEITAVLGTLPAAVADTGVTSQAVVDGALVLTIATTQADSATDADFEAAQATVSSDPAFETAISTAANAPVVSGSIDVGSVPPVVSEAVSPISVAVSITRSSELSAAEEAAVISKLPASLGNVFISSQTIADGTLVIGLSAQPTADATDAEFTAAQSYVSSDSTFLTDISTATGGSAIVAGSVDVSSSEPTADATTPPATLAVTLARSTVLTPQEQIDVIAAFPKTLSDVFISSQQVVDGALVLTVSASQSAVSSGSDFVDAQATITTDTSFLAGVATATNAVLAAPPVAVTPPDFTAPTAAPTVLTISLSRTTVLSSSEQADVISSFPATLSGVYILSQTVLGSTLVLSVSVTQSATATTTAYEAAQTYVTSDPTFLATLATVSNAVLAAPVDVVSAPVPEPFTPTSG